LYEETKQLRDLHRWKLTKTENGYFLYQIFKFYLHFNKLRKIVSKKGNHTYEFFDDSGHRILAVYTNFLPRYILKELDKIVEDE